MEQVDNSTSSGAPRTESNSNFSSSPRNIAANRQIVSSSTETPAEPSDANLGVSPNHSISSAKTHVPPEGSIAVAIAERTPNAYDTTSLSFKVSYLFVVLLAFVHLYRPIIISITLHTCTVVLNSQQARTTVLFICQENVLSDASN